MADSILITDKEVVMTNMKRIEYENETSRQNEVNGLLSPVYADCSIEDRSVTLEFEVKPWEANRAGILHGGIICTMLDHVAGTAVITMAGGWCPTVDIDVRFLKPGKIGDKMVGVGRFVSAGRRIFQMESKLFNKDTGDIIATSTSTFLNTLNK